MVILIIIIIVFIPIVWCCPIFWSFILRPLFLFVSISLGCTKLLLSLYNPYRVLSMHYYDYIKAESSKQLLRNTTREIAGKATF